MSQCGMTWGYRNYCKLTHRERTDKILERSANRERFWGLAIKMLTTAQERGIRLIMENPWSEQTYLKANFLFAPSIVDNNRTMRGDYFIKPTAYWYVNCEPTHGRTIQRNLNVKRVHDAKRGKEAGLCSEERSMIAPDYARNFICDFILGKPQRHTELSLFD